jgi:hypothetical protein
LQLKRFHFDVEKMDMVKLNSTFNFSQRLDLSSFAAGAGTYLLYAVVVHSGDVNSGHYYAHIRPTLENNWVKFDDDQVTRCSEFAAVEDNFGGNDLTAWLYFDKSPSDLRNAQIPTRPRIHNAYMLVYIREDCAAAILKTPDPKLTNSRMVTRCDREVRIAEQRRREKIEQQTKIRVKLVFDRDLRKMCGFWDHSEIPFDSVLKMGREQLVSAIVAEVSAIHQVPKAHIACFSLLYRNNPRQVRFGFMPPASCLRTHIPHFAAPHFDTNDPFLTVLCVFSKSYDVDTFKLKSPGMKPDELRQWHDETITLLIVKYFCALTKKIVTLGSYYCTNMDPLVTWLRMVG